MGGSIGQPMRRREDAALLRGEGSFVADRRPAGCLHVAFVRAERAGMRIAGIDTAAALACPGVAGVFTAADLGKVGSAGVNPLLPDLRPRSFEILAETWAATVGQPLAAIVARTEAQARDAAELVAVTLADSHAPPAPAGYDHVWRNGVAKPGHRVRARHARLAAMPMEPRGALAVWRAGHLTVTLSTQTPHRARADLAAILGLDAGAIRVIASDVGGSFGGKASIFPEDVLTAWAAWRLREAVAWQGSRAEDLLAGTHGRGLSCAGELAMDATGRMVSLRAEIDAPLGHWMPFSAVVPGRNAGRILPGPYLVETVDIALRGRSCATAAMGIYRGAGRPEAAMLMERLVDRAARARGEDPVAFRRRHLIPRARMPFATPTGMVLDDGDFPVLLDRAVALSGYVRHRERQPDRRARGEIVGLGVAMYLEPCGEGWESATLRLRRDGSFLAGTGSSSQGQGRETAFAQILADALGVPPALIEVRHGDTDTTPPGIGALASRSTGIGGGALLAAAASLRAACLPAGVNAPTARHWAEIAAAGEREVTEKFTAAGEAWSSGCCIARIAIDGETGCIAIEQLTLVDDAGIVVNPMLLEGQLHGGIAQGIGEALMERIVYDRDGQLLTGSLMDYALPRATDIPPVALRSCPTATPVNPLGARGVGEAGCIGVPAAIVNAALDALAPFGVTDLDMPLTGETIWRALHGLPQREDVP